ncbi:MAG: DUF2490 domain-containing protein [Novosphingobium sp.]|uniref:DUF2490 domain-containing protein n=1 Tax=Novosphingobium sp. TaxID=1874826 RepID=UPI003B9C4C87
MSLRRISCGMAALFAASVASPAQATEDDFNVWLGQFATINATDKAYVRIEAQERFTNDADRLGQLLLRSLVGYRIDKDVNIGAGYAYVRTDPVGPAQLNEHRFYQELNVRLLSTEGGVTLDSRTRLEQRTFEEREDTSWRLRNFVQLRVPVSQNNKIVAYTEPFLDLNETGVQRGGLSIWRNFVGLSIPLAKNIEIVPGYLNQHVFREGEDRSDHTLNINLFTTF